MRQRWIVFAAAFFIFTVALLVWERRPTTDLTVSVLNVGQGDAIYIAFPTGERWLIDGGPDKSILAELDAILPFGDRRLTGVILTHPHSDHVAGLVSVINRYTVTYVVMPVAEHTSPPYLAFLEAIKQQQLKVIPVDHPFAWGGVSKGVSWRWEFLYPTTRLGKLPDNNETSIVSKLTYGKRSFLFTGDAPADVERALLAAGRNLKSDVLKVGHHGSDTSTSQEFLAAVAPQYAVISLGERNRYGHPSVEVVSRLEKAGASVLRTDNDGAITFYTNGDIVTVDKRP
ncbi:MAG: ComEC/Rec2 family competence protein [Patescibacteria group bacterium]